MNHTYAYCRVSTPKQSIERQVRNAQAFAPNAVIIREVYTGTKFQGRKEFNKLLKKVVPGDTIVFDSVSRMSRNAEEGYKIYQELYSQGVELVFLKERHIDTAAYRDSVQQLKGMMGQELNIDDNDISDMIKGIMACLEKYQLRMLERNIRIAFEQSQKEVDDLHQRTVEGIETARRAGTALGGAGHKSDRNPHKKSVEAYEVIKTNSKTFGGTLSNPQLMKLCNISEPTLLKIKKQIKMEEETPQYLTTV